MFLISFRVKTVTFDENGNVIVLWFNGDESVFGDDEIIPFYENLECVQLMPDEPFTGRYTDGRKRRLEQAVPA